MYPRRARTAVLSKGVRVSKGVHALNNMCPRGHHTVRLVQGVLCEMSKGYTQLSQVVQGVQCLCTLSKGSLKIIPEIHPPPGFRFQVSGVTSR